MMPEDIPIYLITRYLSAEATDEERKELENWLGQSPYHQQILEEHRALWSNMRPQNRFDVDAGLRHINSRIDQFEHTKHSRQGTYIFKIAATLTLIAIVTVLTLNWWPHNLPADTIAWEQAETGAGQQQAILLIDSSRVQLNGKSTLNYPNAFTGSTREVKLSGEAYFDIAPDKQHPFIIHTGEVTTLVVGTSFNIKSDSDAVTVSVTEGTVKVIFNKDTVMLHPGDEVQYNNKTKHVTQGKANLEYVLAWLSGALILTDETLGSVAEKLHQQYGYTSIFDNPDIKKCRITAKFKNMPFEAIVEAIGFSTQTSVAIRNKQIEWRGLGCKPTNTTSTK